MTKQDKDKLLDLFYSLEIEIKELQFRIKLHKENKAAKNDFLKGLREGILQEVEEQEKFLTKVYEEIKKIINK